MFEREARRQVQLATLFGITLLILLLTAKTIFLGWEMAAAILLLLGTAACWVIHVTEWVPETIRLWMYFTLTMLGFFFYGLHETSICDLAPVMIFIIIVYSFSDLYMTTNLCVAAYLFTLLYDLAFVVEWPLESAGVTVPQLVFHAALVYFSGRLVKLALRRRDRAHRVVGGRIEKLEEINRKTEDFMANVSHELRTPINAVTGLTSVMLKNEEDADQREKILSIQLAGHRLFNQIEDILDYTEIDTGRIKISGDTYTIPSVIHDVINGESLPEQEHGLELVFDIDAGIPSVLFGDGRKIKKIIRHLVDNAVKFTKKGGVYVRIYTVRKAYGVNLCIEVSDTGIGIAEENLEKITEKFFQTNGDRNRSSGGLGLGLSIVKGMVSAMEGFIQIESVKEAGTVVSVSIPQKVSDETPCMTMNNRTQLCIGCYLKLEKFEVPKVRYYYDEMILHMVKGLNMPLHKVLNLDELKVLTAEYQLTHLITAREEYEEDPSFFEAMDRSVEVIVVADDGFVPPAGSRILVFRKPFYSWALVHRLNAKASKRGRLLEKKRMVCPGVSVLVVDDESMNLMVAEGLFHDYQMDVKTAQSGMEAIELCGKESFDLIFLDHMMPEMDGVETLKHLRRICMETDNVCPIIAFTANASSSAREMFLREGFDEFVSKPIESMELERVLREVLPKAAIKFLEEDAAARDDGAAGQSAVRPQSEDQAARLEGLGVHTRSGMQYCRGSMEFYEELLVKFAQNERQKGPELSDAFDREDFGKYRILVHALKSSAKMVGADALSEEAKRAEDAAKNSDADYIAAHHEELLGGYRALAEGILQVFRPAESAEAQGDGRELSEAELVSRLEQLKEKLDLFEAESAEALILEMSGATYRGELIGELLLGVRQDVDEFELGAAAEKTGALIRRIKGEEA